ncbi:MAG TPA: hypothetical protein VFS56_09310 [Gemmatimonadaceae bacterium]|nr:hypothetical protein [Gemmatimonadaceae bacterium]
MRIVIATLVVLAILPVQSGAQAAFGGATPTTSFKSASTTSAQVTAGPTIESAAIGIRFAPSTDAAATQRRSTRRSGVSRSVVLMIVGGATMVAGSFIDGDAGTIFMVGGAIIGLWGLYNFLQ